MIKEPSKVISLTAEQAEGLKDVNFPKPVNPFIVVTCRRYVWEHMFKFDKLSIRAKALMGVSVSTMAHVDGTNRWMEKMNASIRN